LAEGNLGRKGSDGKRRFSSKINTLVTLESLSIAI